MACAGAGEGVCRRGTLLASGRRGEMCDWGPVIAPMAAPLRPGTGLESSEMEPLRPFQRRFLASALSPGVDTSALSLSRGNGKSYLAAHVLTRCLSPGDVLHVPGSEYLLCAGSVEQARLCFRFVRAELEPTGAYRWLDSLSRIAATDKRDGTRLRVMSSNGKTAMGIVGCPLLVADEPGAWEATGGTLMHDAIQTAQGKPGSALKVVYIGTIAPARDGWWPSLVKDGSHGSTHVTALQADPAKWDQWNEIRRVNPLTAISAQFRLKLLEERDAARRDTRLKARFLSYRMNVPSADESAVLLTVDDWQRVEGRPVGACEGRPVVGLDLGGGRAWSAAVALWPSGRVEALAVAPGHPGIEDQERRDRVAAGTYQRLADAGMVLTDGKRRVPRVSFVVDQLRRWRPDVIVCDRFRLPELLDCNLTCSVVPRRLMPSEWSEDIRALRRMAADGPLSCEPSSRPLVSASLSVSEVKNDDSGNAKLCKRGVNNTARDDVSAALTLAAGALSRMPARSSGVYLGVA